MKKYEIVYITRQGKNRTVEFSTEHDAFAFIYINQPMNLEAIRITTVELVTS